MTVLPPIGTITLDLEGVSFEECERIREIIHLLVVSGGLGVAYGKTVLHFENRNLMQIETQPTLWKRGKSPPLPRLGEYASVEIRASAQTRTTSGHPG